MVTSFIQENFNTTIFKMVMKHHHYFGCDAQSRRLLNLLSGKFRTVAWGGTLVRKHKAECQIKNGSLFTCKRMAFHGKCADVKRGSIHFWICPYLECTSRGRLASLCITTSDPLLFKKKWSMLLPCEKNINITEGASRDLCSELYQCRYCRTEYKVGFEHDDGCTIEFTITIWKDLGQGPEAEEWKANLLRGHPLSVPPSVRFCGGEIAAVFK